MGKINDWVGAIGGTIVVLELLILLVVLVGINFGLVLGLRWVRGKMSFVREKRLTGQSLVTKYVDRGASVVATPVIVSTSVWRGVKAGLYRATHWPVNAQTPVVLPTSSSSTVVASDDRTANGSRQSI